MYHKLLQRQINKFLKDDDHNLKGFLEAINESYHHYERDHVLLDQSMNISFKEIEEQNQLLEQEIEIRKQAILNLQQTLNNLLEEKHEVSEIQNDNFSAITQLINKQIERRKDIEKQLILQNDELKKINSELDSFVHSTSHDLRAPLTSIQGLVGIIRISDDDEEINLCLKYIDESITRLDTFIQNIVNYSKNARTQLKTSEINLSSFFQEIFDNLYFLLQEKKIEKEIVLEQDAILLSDSTRLHIIINNLISNAIKYADQKKETSKIKIKVHITTEKALFTISDNGIGIEEQHLSELFNMFYRATHQNHGAGLGLYIVKEIVTFFQGKISVSSKFQEGTSFHLEIPNLLNN